MGANFSLIEVEKLTWTDHTIVYDATVREANLEMVDKAFPDGSIIRLGYQERNFGGLDYQHWFITDGEGRYFLEFASPQDYYYARVQINTFPHAPCVFENNKCKMDSKIKERVLHVLGMSNYSLCLRNCEHIANYVFRGRWLSFQMDETGPLMTQYFKKVILDENKRKVNTFPSSIRPDAFSEGKEKQIYSFIGNHYKCNQFSYYLDHNDDKTYNILVIGPTGAGKSRLINVFFNQPVSDSRVSHKSVTKEICFYKGRGSVFNYETGKQEERNIVVADTVGLCDTEWDDAKILSLIKGRVSSNFKYIDAVFVVFKADRLLKDQVSSIKAVMEWLGYDKKNNHLNFLFVGTCADNLSDDEKSRLGQEASDILGLKTTERTVDENAGVIAPMKYDSLVYTGFPPETSLNENGKKGVEKSWDLLQPLLLLSTGESLKTYYEVLEKKKFSRLSIPSMSSCNIL